MIEPGAETASRLFRRFDVVSSAITPLELTSALVRRRAAAELTDRQFVQTVGRIREDRTHWRLVEPGDQVLSQAEEIIGTTVVRTLDALHLASCLIFALLEGAHLPFVTADARQRAAAERAQLTVVWVA